MSSSRAKGLSAIFPPFTRCHKYAVILHLTHSLQIAQHSQSLCVMKSVSRTFYWMRKHQPTQIPLHFLLPMSTLHNTVLPHILRLFCADGIQCTNTPHRMINYGTRRNVWKFGDIRCVRAFTVTSFWSKNKRNRKKETKKWAKVTSIFVSLTPKQSGCRHIAFIRYNIKYVKCHSYNSYSKEF